MLGHGGTEVTQPGQPAAFSDLGFNYPGFISNAYHLSVFMASHTSLFSQ